MRRRNTVILVLLLLGAALAGWWFASPWWTLRQIREAAASKDAARLSAYVDYPALRADLKDEWSRRLLGTRSVRAGSIEGLVAATIAGPLIDNLVTPQGVRAMFEVEQVARQPGAAPETAGGRLPHIPAAKDQPVIERDGLNQFRVHSRQPGSAGIVFRRHGLEWKLAGVDLAPPPNEGAPT